MAGGYFGYQKYAAVQVDGANFEMLEPGRVSIVGVQAGKGYRIVVANQVAQLIEAGNENFQNQENYDEGAEESSSKKRVPLKEMLQTLQGNEKALGEFVTSMNDDLKKADLPMTEVKWPADKILAAMDGNKELRTKLEQDLNMHLDGTPLDQIRPNSIQDGIVVLCKVPVQVAVRGQKRDMYGEVKIPFKPRFIQMLQKSYEEEFNVTRATILGNYQRLRQELVDSPGNREDIERALRTMVDPEGLRNRFADSPSRVLEHAFVALNDSFLESASYRESDGPDGKKFYDIDLNLNDEGRRRLWQYSRRNPGAQLLFVVDGIAIAAPRIRTELSQSTVTIRQIPDLTLVQDAVDLINSLRKNGK